MVVAEAAIGVARASLSSPGGVAVVDRLTATVLDRSRAGAVRIAALKALADLPPATLSPLLSSLQNDPDQGLRKLATQQPSGMAGRPGPRAVLKQAVAGRLPDDPVGLRRAVGEGAHRLSLTDLERLVTAIRDRELTASQGQQQAWMAVRAALHAALADRGSKLALYDLRETLQSARRALPVEFITVLLRAGDASCLEPIASAYAHVAPGEVDRDWWHEHLVEAFGAIVRRDRVTRRHAAVKRIEKRWPAALQALWPVRTANTPSRTRPRR